MLREIFENLLTNAIKYTPEGGAIFVHAEHQKGSVTIRVRDTGCGIPKDQQDKIFSRFFRAENAMSIDTEGTGLGLYLVSQLVRTLGGSISFTSDEGKGTEFVLTLDSR
jgi:signal transduction histidine kinase